MALWVWIDDSIDVPELLVGAAVAVMGALVAEVVESQAATHVRIRFEWLARALPIPLQVVRDLATVFTALFRKVAMGEEPRSRLEEVPVRGGGDSPEDVTRRALLVAAASIAPNTFALGIDKERNVMIVHKLVPSHGPRRRGDR
jgi:multisubunit Na+/H+ antiporter MnhE subunit